jgi:PAS domain S-box-containing protein
MREGEAQSDSREQPLLRRNGSAVWVVWAIPLVRDADGQPKHFVSVTQDISESKMAEERLLHLLTNIR